MAEFVIVKCLSDYEKWLSHVGRVGSIGSIGMHRLGLGTRACATSVPRGCVGLAHVGQVTHFFGWLTGLGDESWVHHIGR
jgi:hypothetical protein